MRIRIVHILMLVLAACFICCKQKPQPDVTPWGTTLTDNDVSSGFTIDDIQANGEMIMVTMSGPDTYYEYRGKQLGTQYLICENFAQKIGVSLRVEVCKDVKSMIKKLNDGDADIIAYQVSKSVKGVIHCGYSSSDNSSWVVKEGNKKLAEAINKWYTPEIAKDIKRDEYRLTSIQSVHRHVYAPMLNAKTGTISQYDHLFMRYAPLARWDWRLLAAQCYQESCFDSKAYSWAGARGLMQIMPSTAAYLGLQEDKIYDPEENIYAAVRYINELNSKFNDIRDTKERQLYVLASYNGGFFHIRDAMALARKYGKNPYHWNDVAEYVLKLKTQEFYNDPVVKYGYMRGNETVDYVERIRNRWFQYKGKAHTGTNMPSVGLSTGEYTPHEASNKHRFKL